MNPLTPELLTDALAQFHFLRPWWLLALLLLPLLLWQLAHNRAGEAAWSRVCDAHLLAHLLTRGNRQRQRSLGILLGTAWVLGVLALAGPTWSQQPLPVYANQAARVLVLDLSQSMNAVDLKPSRLQRAKFKINDILLRSEDVQTGLIVYAGDAFTVTPLTVDTETIANLLPALDSTLMPLAGSRLEPALQQAQDLLQQAGVQQGQVIVLTDSVAPTAEYDATLARAAQLAAQGYSVSVLGIGTLQGAPVTAASGELLKDDTGAIVVAQLDEAGLRALARQGQGQYARISVDASDLDQVLLELTEALANDDNLSTARWHDQGPWLVLLLLPLAALAFRPGWLFVLALLCLPLPRPASALEWSDLWLRRDQQAAQALTQQNAEQALQLATDPWQRGTAAYRLGDYEQAAEQFARMPDAAGHYNRGNALALAGRLQEALAAYSEALALQPDFTEAQANREQVEQLLKEQQQQQQQQQQQRGAQDESTKQESSGDGQADEQAGQTNPEPNNTDQQSDDQQQAQGDQSQSSGDPQNQDNENESEQSAEDAAQSEQSQESEEQQAQEANNQQTAQAGSDPLTEEEQQIMDQWLRRIPDDPGGLLRRKFLYQYKNRPTDPADNIDPW
ncbi:MAG: VWA domain-containing protein [Candidatus Competibacteraceae bacterium]|nr:VWA domain-containing protein [Candidatus Competibacteraceae bacterium]MCB1814008.1 VWA domain-containing protein [Candidatus Competibacteraceae bacterium]